MSDEELADESNLIRREYIQEMVPGEFRLSTAELLEKCAGKRDNVIALIHQSYAQLKKNGSVDALCKRLLEGFICDWKSIRSAVKVEGKSETFKFHGLQLC